MNDNPPRITMLLEEDIRLVVEPHMVHVMVFEGERVKVSKSIRTEFSLMDEGGAINHPLIEGLYKAGLFN